MRDLASVSCQLRNRYTDEYVYLRYFFPVKNSNISFVVVGIFWLHPTLPVSQEYFSTLLSLSSLCETQREAFVVLSRGWG